MEEMNCMEKPMAALNLFTEVNGVKITMPCDKLFEALAKMQGALDNAKKESDNPYFKSKYADLATCLQTAKKPMADNGLSISQHCTFDGQFVQCVTILGHSSGQMMISTLMIPVAKKDAQGIGSSITYARRYALSSIIGLTQKDDDGEGAVGRTEKDAETKWEKTAKKSQEILRNADKLNEQESWRLTNEGIQVKWKDGSWVPLNKIELRYLEVMLNMEKFEGIKKTVQDMIAEIKRA
jgi:hypothetical protein